MIDDLIARLRVSAATVASPILVEVPGLGALYVRKRTVKEFEDMAIVGKPKDGDPEYSGVFASSIVRLLCDETGKRFTVQQEAVLIPLLAKQPEAVFHAIVDASDGTAAKQKAEEPGNSPSVSSSSTS